MQHDKAALRRSLRLKGFDYSQPGAYFVTVCTEGRQPLLGSATPHGLEPSPAGAMVAETWLEVTSRPGLDSDAFVVMPDHFHGIVVLEPRGGWNLPSAVRSFKSLATTRYVHGVRDLGWAPFPGRLWQRNYYETVVRNEWHLGQLRRYIGENPARWLERHLARPAARR